MSHVSNGKYLRCDAAGCTACVEAPVTLPPASTEARKNTSQSRWLFVQRGGVWYHFCPAHVQTAFPSVTDPQSQNNPLPSGSTLLVVDSSAESYQSAEQIADWLAGNDDARLTMLFSACARCMPQTDGDTPPMEAYCPGTRRAISQLMTFWEERKIPVCLQVQSSPTIPERIAQESTEGDYEVIVLSIALSLPTRTSLPVLTVSSEKV